MEYARATLISAWHSGFAYVLGCTYKLVLAFYKLIKQPISLCMTQVVTVISVFHCVTAFDCFMLMREHMDLNIDSSSPEHIDVPVLNPLLVWPLKPHTGSWH